MQLSRVRQEPRVQPVELIPSELVRLASAQQSISRRATHLAGRKRVQGCVPTKCETWQQRIDAYLDSELLEGENSRTRSCPLCALQALTRSELKAAAISPERICCRSRIPKADSEQHNPQELGSALGWIVDVGTVYAAVLLVTFGSLA